MLSTHDPMEFWKAIGRITGWRLASFDGFHEAIFVTAVATTVVITGEIANVLDTLVSAIGDLTYSSLSLMETVTALVSGTTAEKREAKKAIASDMENHRRELVNLQQDLPHFFGHYKETEQRHEAEPRPGL